MKEFRTKFLVSKNAAKATTTAPVNSGPQQPQLTRKQRRANATSHRLLTQKINKATELGRPVSIQQGRGGRLEVVVGKAKKPDPGPQPGEVITEVSGNTLPELPTPEVE
jgi:hypothetical protein